ncbi:hypothetical protein H2201_007701 [Coniosporium apollinis]|uniref:Ribosomal protein S15 n=1 Tax=Coniosporium apollinis TaxID=61459 RepID=A0ABQ9NI52_9PEZI|nr:hypothetical protein H2201_007701 [Coniosporium apollinis]
MPPRIPILTCLRAQTASHHCSTSPSALLRPFSATPARDASTATHRRKSHDPYVLAQARARKAANLSRQTVLRQERSASIGDPVRGITTPFVESFDTGLPPITPDTLSKSRNPAQKAGAQDTPLEEHAQHGLTPAQVEKSLSQSELINAALYLERPRRADETRSAAEVAADDARELAMDHHNRATALRRIVNLANASSKDRTKVNTQRCISTFGRHNTDRTLFTSSTPPSVTLSPADGTEAPTTETAAETSSILSPTTLSNRRAGPDTGSSEVQIAILTAKIRTLANFLGTRGKQDKVNKRNLRLLVHRRQKLLAYMRRKERAGPRWTHLIETLGLTEATWRGEISL